MSLLKYIKNIKKFSVILIPDDPSEKSLSLKFSPKNVVLWLLVYTILCVFIGFYAVSLTGLDSFLLPADTGLREANKQKIERLNQKIIFLAKELEGLKVSNQKLKYALILGDSTIFDSLQQVPDSVEQNNGKKIEGNLSAILTRLFFEVKNSQQDFIFIKPVTGYISRHFNPLKGHMGIDYVVKEGTPVYAAGGGYIIFADYTIDDGYMIIINHGNGFLSIYKHLSTLIKHQRDIVEQGELIALSGNSGRRTTGPHLHFELWQDGKPVNPEKLLINY